MTTFTTKILDIGVPTITGRIYPAEEIARAVQLANLPLLGQVGVPESNQINLENVSHQVTALRIVDNELFADVVVLDTEKGRALADILPSVSFRLAGIGFVQPDTKVVSDFSISSINAEVL